MEVGVSCVRRVGFAEHGLRRLPRTRVVFTRGMAFPDVLRCLPRVPLWVGHSRLCFGHTLSNGRLGLSSDEAEGEDI